MESGITAGNEPLGSAGLVTFQRCGHWWVYPVIATAEEMEEVAGFHLGVACSFCMGGLYAATRPHAGGTKGRVN